MIIPEPKICWTIESKIDGYDTGPVHDSTFLLSDKEKWADLQRNIWYIFSSSIYVWPGLWYPHLLIPITEGKIRSGQIKCQYSGRQAELISEIFVGSARVAPVRSKIANWIDQTVYIPEAITDPKQKEKIRNSFRKNFFTNLTKTNVIVNLTTTYPTMYSAREDEQKIYVQLNIDQLADVTDTFGVTWRGYLMHYLRQWERAKIRNYRRIGTMD